MAIQQSAFLVNNGMGEFIGIVAFDPMKRSAKQAAEVHWGSASEYTELSWDDLLRRTKAGISVFTASHYDG